MGADCQDRLSRHALSRDQVPADAAPAVLKLIIIAHMELEAIAERCIAGDPTWRERLNQVVGTLVKLERAAPRPAESEK